MFDITEKFKGMGKFDFFSNLAQLINITPIDIIEGEMKLTLTIYESKIKLIFNGIDNVTDYDKWVGDFGDSLLKDFNNDKIKIYTHYNVQTHE